MELNFEGVFNKTGQEKDLKTENEPSKYLKIEDRSVMAQKLGEFKDQLKYIKSLREKTAKSAEDMLFAVLTYYHVKDNGIGMTQQELEKIYKKFYRAKRADSNIGGLGLGMTIVKMIIESHKGQIIVDSEKGVGTTITISLPINL